MILLGNKQNSLILLGFFSFSRMEIPVYNLGECTPWGVYLIVMKKLAASRFSNMTTPKANTWGKTQL